MIEKVTLNKWKIDKRSWIWKGADLGDGFGSSFSARGKAQNTVKYSVLFFSLQ